MKVSRLMTDRPYSLPRGATLQSAMDLMDEHDLRHVIVMDGEDVLGIVGDRELYELTGWLHPRQREVLGIAETCLGDHLGPSYPSVTIDASIAEIAALFVRERIGCVPVLDDGRLRGVVSELDVLRAYADACRIGHVGAHEEPTLASLMTPDPRTIEADAPGDEAAERMKQHAIRHLPVLSEGRLVGIVSDRDVRLARGRGELELHPVSSLMGAGLETARPTDRLGKAARVFASARIGALPIVQNEHLLGIVSLVDVLTPCAAALSS